MELAQELTDENIASVLSFLSLASLPSCGAAARRWRDASALGFSRQLLWQREAHYKEVGLPNSQLGDGFVTFLGDGDSLILAAAHEQQRILTFQLPDGSWCVFVNNF